MPATMARRSAYNLTVTVDNIVLLQGQKAEGFRRHGYMQVTHGLVMAPLRHLDRSSLLWHGRSEGKRLQSD